MRISATRIEVTVFGLGLLALIALAVAPAWWGHAFGQDLSTPTQSNTTNGARTIAQGERGSVEGIVINRDHERFTVRQTDGSETQVIVTNETEIKTVRKGLFRSDKITSANQIVRGLRLTVDGRGNGQGQLVASRIRFDEQDLRTAQSLESRVDPVETQANATQALAEANRQRITTVEESARLLSGQIDEVSAVANGARVAASNAQNTADKAEADANTANERIGSLDDYDVLRTITVQFRPGSAVLSSTAKAKLDEAAESIQCENLKGWLLEIVGYADSTGNTAFNRSLSQRRANSVINYLATKHDLPLRRLVQPFGYGSDHPVASNDTREGRALNRRAEIRVMVNKGITNQSGSEEKTAVVQLTNLP